jgi:hypothetical protein
MKTITIICRTTALFVGVLIVAFCLYQLDFSDLPNFGKFFKKEVGISFLESKNGKMN